MSISVSVAVLASAAGVRAEAMELNTSDALTSSPLSIFLYSGAMALSMKRCVMPSLIGSLIASSISLPANVLKNVPIAALNFTRPLAFFFMDVRYPRRSSAPAPDSSPKILLNVATFAATMPAVS